MAVNEHKYRVVKLRYGWQVRVGSDKHGYHAAGYFNNKADAKAQADSLNGGHGPAFPGTGTGLYGGPKSNPSAIPAKWTPATVSRKGGQIQIRMGGRR
jgi:hypothetical protein